MMKSRNQETSELKIECPICYENLAKQIKLPCNHVICYSCTIKIYQMSKVEPIECPFDRKTHICRIDELIGYYGKYIAESTFGRGKLVLNDQTIFSGQWKGRFLDGENCLVQYADGMSLIGSFKFGQLDGIGKKKWQSGGFEEGNFINGELQGQGLRKWPDGGQEQGKFQNGKLSGKGSRVWANGGKEEGEFIDGKLNRGYCMWPDGGEECGSFFLDKLDGEGYRINATGWKEFGFFNQGMLVLGFRKLSNGQQDVVEF